MARRNSGAKGPSVHNGPAAELLPHESTWRISFLGQFSRSAADRGKAHAQRGRNDNPIVGRFRVDDEDSRLHRNALYRGFGGCLERLAVAFQWGRLRIETRR